jgi:signal transduction histidine kinase
LPRGACVFQYILPNHAWWANRAVPVSIGLLVATGAAFALNYVRFKTTAARFTRLLGRAAATLAALSFVLPYAHVIRAEIVVALLMCVVGFVEPITNLRGGDRRAKLYLAGWGFFLAGAIANLLRFAGVVPTNFVTSWSMQIGAVLQVVFLSTALADSINVMRANLATLNGTLSDKVVDLEQALRRAEEATSRAELATHAKDEFMATMSHKFRTPLNAIINIPQGLLEQFPVERYLVCGRCTATFQLEAHERLSHEAVCPECGDQQSLREQHIQRYVGKPEHTARYLAKVERSGQHLLQVVNGILDFSKLEAGRLTIEPERVQIAGLLQETLDQMSDLADRAKVRLVCMSTAMDAYANADPLRIRQVLINLVGNAIKFSNGRGTVTLDVQEQRDAYLFSVRDQGIGIAKENLETVFGSFEQVHKGNSRKYGGTGLGLAIARSLVRMHGGDLWVESVLGQGSVFFFSVPKHRPDPESAMPSAGARSSASGARSVAPQENVT